MFLFNSKFLNTIHPSFERKIEIQHMYFLNGLIIVINTFKVIKNFMKCLDILNFILVDVDKELYKIYCKILLQVT